MIVQIIRSFNHAVSKSSWFLPVNITKIISSLLNANQCTVIVNKLLLITSQIINFHSWNIWSEFPLGETSEELRRHMHAPTYLRLCTRAHTKTWLPDLKRNAPKKNLTNNKKIDKKFNYLKSICFFISCTEEWYLMIVKGRCMPTSMLNILQVEEFENLTFLQLEYLWLPPKNGKISMQFY